MKTNNAIDRSFASVDTIKLSAYPITDEIYRKIINKGQTKQLIDNETGEQHWGIQLGSIKSSFEKEIKVQPRDYYFAPDPIEKIPKQFLCNKDEKYLDIEFSLPKNIFGINAVSYTGFEPLLRRIATILEQSFDIRLPDIYQWEIGRIDMAINFELPKSNQVSSFIDFISHLEYPRRKGYIYPGSGMYFKGKTTTVKFYHKYQEFHRHDEGDWKRYLTSQEKSNTDKKYIIQEFKNRFKGILRCEVEFKAKKLALLFEKHYPDRHFAGERHFTIKDILYGGTIDFNDLFQIEINRIFSGTKTSKQQDYKETRRYILTKGKELGHSPKVLYRLLDIYTSFVFSGKAETREMQAERTFYYYQSILKKDFDISFVETDSNKNRSEYRGFPTDFDFLEFEKSSYFQQKRNYKDIEKDMKNLLKLSPNKDDIGK